MLSAGVKAPQFRLEDLSGESRTLSGLLASGPVLLALYKIGCPVCQMTAPYLERISKGSLQVIGISQDDARGTARFGESFGLTVPSLIDKEGDGYPASSAFGIAVVPSLFLVEADGVISVASEGFVKRDLEALGKRAGVATFLAGEQVPEWKAG